MAWQLDEQAVRLNESRDRRSTVDHGWKFHLLNDSGQEHDVRVMGVRGTRQLSRHGARRTLTPYLNDDTVPSMLVVDADGRARPYH